MYKLKVLVCDDMEHVRLAHEDAVYQCGSGIFQAVVRLAETAEEALGFVQSAAAAQAPYDLVLMDVNFQAPAGETCMNGFDAVAAIHEVSPETVIGMISSHDTMDNQELADKCSYVDKFFRRGSFDLAELKQFCVYALIRSLHAKKALIAPKKAAHTQAATMLKYLKRVDRIGVTETVTIYGETGTGKQLTAERISANTRVATGDPERPFVSLNCAGLTPTLLMAELFGHAREAFTGASQDRVGWLEKAHDGDLFLDELQNAPEDFQMALLGFLQTGEFSRVGTTQVKKVNVRVIAALNRSPDEAMKAGVIREDLLGRLQQRYLVIPPLREREGDIPSLIEHFRKLHGKADKVFSREAIDFLNQMPWKTNVRGIKAVVESAVDESKLPTITVSAIKRLELVKHMLLTEAHDDKVTLPAAPPTSTPVSSEPPAWELKAQELAETCLKSGVSLENILDGVERSTLSLLIRQERQVVRMAKRAQMSESTLRGKLKKHQLFLES